jgi:hypothetical protein
LQSIIPVICPIFDGTKALSASMREWLSEMCPGCLDDLDGKSEKGRPEVRVYCNKWWYYGGQRTSKNQNGIAISSDLSQRIQRKSQKLESSKNEALSVVLQRVLEQFASSSAIVMAADNQINRYSGCSERSEEKADFGEEEKEDIEESGKREERRRWKENLNTFPSSETSCSSSSSNSTVSLPFSLIYEEEEILYFYMCPIIKKSNHRKHNSHQWFFDSICEGLNDKITYAFLTDCGTSYSFSCLPLMLKELFLMNDLIGVTARMRVEFPSQFFHPCQDSAFPFLVGNHEDEKKGGGGRAPCWRCWASFLLSPCPLQGFELESSLSLSFAMFNLIEVLPVMPGPCQMMNWQKMKQFRVVDEYFNLLFEGESDKKAPLDASSLPVGLKTMSFRSTDGKLLSCCCFFSVFLIYFLSFLE